VPIRLHEEDPALLREAIRFTSAETGFTPRLIEKDYFCSVALEYLAASGAGLTFKGGTCLSKIHGAFHRLSEDLDFSISTALESSRGDRSRSVGRLKAAVESIPGKLPAFRIAGGIIEAAKEVEVKIPLVVRLEGTNAGEGREMLKGSGLKLEVAETMWQGAQKIVGMVRR